MTVERYSHIMHLESTVVGDLAARPDAPTTCSGDVPGRHALRRAEAARDGASSTSSSRAGAASTAASWATSTSPATSTWRSRSAPRCIKDGRAYVQAGGGIVADSVPQLEHEECVNKAAAALRAVATAAGLRAP